MASSRLGLAILAALLSGTACASGRLPRENAMALATADGSVLEGCYDCLLQARDAYERLADSKYSRPDTLALRLFETNLLLALRDKELQLDWSANLARAKLVAKRLPAHIDADRVLRIAESVLPNGTGRRSDWPARQIGASARVTRIADDVSWLNSAPLRASVREYFTLALDCSYDAQVLAPRQQPGATSRRPVLSPDATPLIMYRTGICLGADTNMLAAVMAMVPKSYEAAFHHATRSVFTAEVDGGVAVTKLLDSAYKRFPKSPAVTHLSGWLASVNGDCVGGTRWFGETLAIDSTHEFGLLHNTECLSRLKEDSAVLAMATRLIALNTPSTQRAYYLRAASRLRLRDLPSARSDIEAAKWLEREGNALTLGGIIENEQNDLGVAELDLREARAREGGDQNCVAAWTLGLVLDKAKRPADAGDAFESALVCFDIRVTVIRSTIARLTSTPSRNPAHTARRVAALAADSTDQRTRFYASAFNAAGQRATMRNFLRALELLEIAGRDSSLAEHVVKLQQAIRAAMMARRTYGTPIQARWLADGQILAWRFHGALIILGVGGRRSRQRQGRWASPPGSSQREWTAWHDQPRETTPRQ